MEHRRSAAPCFSLTMPDAQQPDTKPIACPVCGSRSVTVLSARDNFKTVSLKCGSCQAVSMANCQSCPKDERTNL
jgi:hypothetical protein